MYARNEFYQTEVLRVNQIFTMLPFYVKIRARKKVNEND